MKDLIIGCIVNYLPNDIAPWVNSIRKCGFTGDVVVIEFGVPDETKKYLIDNGMQVYHGELNGRHIVVERFISMYTLLNEIGDSYGYVLSTDVKDVVLNKDPFEFIRRMYPSRQLLASSENVLYRNDPWGDNNLKVSYPHMYDIIKSNMIYNAGVIAGCVDYIKDLFLHIYHLSLIGGDPQSDQAAYNILIATEPFHSHVQFCPHEDRWAAQIGTNLEMTIEDLAAYYIIHQYDRVPALKQIILDIFK